MSITFQKMHGAGNDFVLLDLRAQEFRVDAATAAALANRHTGIGCDQLLVLRAPATPDCVVAFEIWNADGSRAEQCGNGVRCIGRYLESRGEVTRERFRIGGPAGKTELECLDGDRVRVNMGAPEFDPRRIPVTAPEVEGGWYALAGGGDPIRVGAVSMGNPHALLVVDDIAAAPVSELGPLISRHPDFPAGCNAGFAEVMASDRVELRVFERGTGETRACGSGACAAVAILGKSGLVGQQVLVNQVGGALIIEWSGPREPIIMTGPASHVFEGIVQ